jgi:hypothetical protein
MHAVWSAIPAHEDEAVATSGTSQVIHCLLGFRYRAASKRQIVLARRAVADAGKIESHGDKSHCSKNPCQLDVKAIETHPVHNPRIQEDNGRQRA